MQSPDSAITLTGITWNHTRGFLPVLATAQRFAETHPGVEIQWQKRSLQAFADAPLAQLTASFDLLVIDHPSIGEAASEELFIPLDQHLPASFLAGQAAHSVGRSHASYHYEGHQYALAIDAATPVAAFRPDLFARDHLSLPRTWDDLLALARLGRVTVPAIPIDSLMNLFMLLNAVGAEPFTTPDEVIPPTHEDQGREALALLRELVHLAAPGSLDRNPIRTWQLLASSDTVSYCPFAYGYSNYSRPAYAPHPIQACSPVDFRGTRLRSTLGGAGIALSARLRQNPAALAVALEYAAYTASPEVQSTLYTLAGGQPGHRTAWLDPTLNALTRDFFTATLPTLDAAWVRPRFPGFIAFQDAASTLVHHYLVHGGAESAVLQQLNAALRQHKQPHRKPHTA